MSKIVSRESLVSGRTAWQCTLWRVNSRASRLQDNLARPWQIMVKILPIFHFFYSPIIHLFFFSFYLFFFLMYLFFSTLQDNLARPWQIMVKILPIFHFFYSPIIHLFFFSFYLFFFLMYLFFSTMLTDKYLVGYKTLFLKNSHDSSSASILYVGKMYTHKKIG